MSTGLYIWGGKERGGRGCVGVVSESGGGRGCYLVNRGVVGCCYSLPMNKKAPKLNLIKLDERYKKRVSSKNVSLMKQLRQSIFRVWLRKMYHWWKQLREIIFRVCMRCHRITIPYLFNFLSLLYLLHPKRQLRPIHPFAQFRGPFAQQTLFSVSFLDWHFLLYSNLTWF